MGTLLRCWRNRGEWTCRRVRRCHYHRLRREITKRITKDTRLARDRPRRRPSFICTRFDSTVRRVRSKWSTIWTCFVPIISRGLNPNMRARRPQRLQLRRWRVSRRLRWRLLGIIIFIWGIKISNGLCFSCKLESFYFWGVYLGTEVNLKRVLLFNVFSFK